MMSIRVLFNFTLLIGADVATVCPGQVRVPPYLDPIKMHCRLAHRIYIEMHCRLATEYRLGTQAWAVL